MLRFQRFPIYVIYSRHRQQAVDPLWKQYYQQRQAAREKAVQQLLRMNLGEMRRYLEIAQQKDDLISAAIQWQLIEDLDPKYRAEIRSYEATIERILSTISHTSIGSSLLSMIRGDAKVFVIPADWDNPTAVTETRSEAEGGGIRIAFSPSAFRSVIVAPHKTADEAEDTLFHELVHAMRMSNGRYGGRVLINSDFRNTEEFIATQLENVFHAARRSSDIYSAYYGGYRRKEAMYQYLVEDAELVMALKFFLRSEPLCGIAAGLHQPAYNPFRDFAEIERRSLKHYGIDKFNDF